MANDCDASDWPAAPSDEADADQDGWMICNGDCDDGNATNYPGAPELCNGVAEDCDAPNWPAAPAEEIDADEDGFMTCEGDCDDGAPDVHPGQTEVCNGFDDDCDGLRDEDAAGEDADGDGVLGLCDNCPATSNPSQADGQGDGEGDACDLDDGLIYVRFHQSEYVEWQEELGFASWNSYRGDLAVLRGTGLYTQDPSLVPLASRDCDLTVPWKEDLDPPAGAALFFLTTGNYAGTGVENGLGVDSEGIERINANPCP
jgi:hypothetical protein